MCDSTDKPVDPTIDDLWNALPQDAWEAYFEYLAETAGETYVRPDRDRPNPICMGTVGKD